MLRLNTTLLNSKWVKDEIKREIKYIETNKNGNTTYQNLWDSAKALQRGEFVVINGYIKKNEIYQINNLTFTSRKEKQE